jgi:signal transduction histidine kinase
MTIGGETDVRRVLDLIVKRARALVDARALLVFLRRGERLDLAARAGDLGDRAEELTIPPGDEIFSAVTQQRVSRRLEPNTPPSEARLRERLGAEAALVVPLLFRGQAVGALVALDHEGGSQFDQEDMRLLQAFAASAATAVGTAQGVEAERLQQRVEISEGERRRWAQELHDDALQGLAAIRISLATAMQARTPDRAERIEEAAEETLERLERQINELSRLINDLRPAPLERLGLAGALEALAEEWGQRGAFEVDTEIDLEAKRISGEEERAVYRLVQEALTNVIKHASAGKATVRVEVVDEGIGVAVEDDGDGFDVDSLEAGRGLQGMRERIALLGGEIDIRSERGGGTRISARIPLHLE